VTPFESFFARSEDKQTLANKVEPASYLTAIDPMDYVQHKWQTLQPLAKCNNFSLAINNICCSSKYKKTVCKKCVEIAFLRHTIETGESKQGQQQAVGGKQGKQAEADSAAPIALYLSKRFVC